MAAPVEADTYASAIKEPKNNTLVQGILNLLSRVKGGAWPFFATTVQIARVMHHHGAAALELEGSTSFGGRNFH